MDGILCIYTLYAIMPEIYLDNNSTTMPYTAVTKAMAKVQSRYYGNPSTSYQIGKSAKDLIRSGDYFQEEADEHYRTNVYGGEERSAAVYNTMRFIKYGITCIAGYKMVL
jgi:hypothetical protein